MATKRRAASEPLALGSRFLLLPPPPAKRSRRGELEPALLPWATAAARCLERGGGGPKKRKTREEGVEEEPPGGRKRRCNNNSSSSSSDQEEEEEEGTVNCKCPSAAKEIPKEKRKVFLRGAFEDEEEEEKSASSSSSRGSPTQENEDDVWRYNSFQYWRSPLPTIHLSDILDLENNRAVDESESSSTGMSEMET